MSLFTDRPKFVSSQAGCRPQQQCSDRHSAADDHGSGTSPPGG